MTRFEIGIRPRDRRWPVGPVAGHGDTPRYGRGRRISAQGRAVSARGGENGRAFALSTV